MNKTVYSESDTLRKSPREFLHIMDKTINVQQQKRQRTLKSAVVYFILY